MTAILPWLASLIESATFPGGWEIKFRNLENAVEKVIAEVSPHTERTESPDRAPFQVWAPDPSVALVALRIEIEERVRTLAERPGIPNDRSMMRLFNRLRETGVLNDSSLSGLQELVSAGNSAAHGASIEPGVAEWAFEYAPKVIAALNATLDQILGWLRSHEH